MLVCWGILGKLCRHQNQAFVLFFYFSLKIISLIILFEMWLLNNICISSHIFVSCCASLLLWKQKSAGICNVFYIMHLLTETYGSGCKSWRSQANTSSYLQRGLWDVCTGSLSWPGGSLEDSAKRWNHLSVSILIWSAMCTYVFKVCGESLSHWCALPTACSHTG